MRLPPLDFSLARMLLDVIRGDKMKTLTWKPILSNLEEANGELRRLHWQLHYLTFGELPSDCPRRHDSSYMAWNGLRGTWNVTLLTKEDSSCVWSMLFIISTGRGTAAMRQRIGYGTLQSETPIDGRSSRTRRILPIFGHRTGQSGLERMIVSCSVAHEEYLFRL